jgi:pyruvate dehydrogenase E1 component beta subunit
VKVVMPSTPADFKSLLKSAIRDDNPVLFYAGLGLLHTPGEVRDDDAIVPLGKAAVRRAGSDVTLISYAKTMQTCIDAANALQEQGVSAEVLDLRSLKPLDEASVLASVRKTGRAVVVHEAAGPCGVVSVGAGVHPPGGAGGGVRSIYS